MKNLFKIILVSMLAAGLCMTFASCSEEDLSFSDCKHTYSNDCDANCNECGEERDVEGHVSEADDGDCTTPVMCKNCGSVMVSGKNQHVANSDDGDCTTPVTCTQCDSVLNGDKVKENHAFDGVWQYDTQEHWHVCTNEGCSVTDTKAAHNKNENGVCSDCGYIIEVKPEHTHEYNIANKSDASGHWNECNCGARDTVVAHTAAEKDSCTDDTVCGECGWVLAQGENHTPGTDDNDCTTDIKCTECGNTAVSGNNSHVDSDGDGNCDVDGCEQTVKGITDAGANTDHGWGEIIRPNR